MSKVIIVYGSTTGNTQNVAEKVSAILSGAGHEVTIKNVTEANKDELVNYEVILMASSTWNDGELQDDFIGFHMDLESNPPDLKGKKIASFGCGESVYEHFCTAVETLQNSMSKWGGEKLLEGLKIDGYPDDEENIKKIEDWSTELLSKL